MKPALLALGIYFCTLTLLPAADAVTKPSRDLERLRHDVAERPRDLDAEKRLATYCLKYHLEDEAVTAAEATVALAPNNREANELYVTALARAGKYEEASNAWTTMLGEPDGQTRRVLEAADLARQADVTLQQAGASPVPATPVNPNQRISPNDPLGTALSPQDDYRAAAGLLEKAVAKDPDNLAIRLTLGWVYLDRLHEPRPALRHLEFVARRHPGDVNARKLYGLACLQTGQPAQAVTEFRAALQLTPDDEWVRVQLAKSLARTGRFHEAGELYAEVLVADPTNYEERLGRAELAAWEGYSAEPLKSLNELVREDPTNVDALVLRGNIHLWDWDLAAARQDYSNALAVSDRNYEALAGLNNATIMGDPSLNLDAYQFTDTAGYRRESAELGGRLPVTERVYLLADAAGWRFTQQFLTNVDRVDGSAGLEIHWARWLETTAEGDLFGYHDRNTYGGAHASTKLTIAPGYDIYAAGAYRQPFVSSIATVITNLKYDTAGGGFDFRLYGPLSFQNSLQLARITDTNNWWEDKPQLSWCLYERWGAYIRAQYDYLDYRHSLPAYYSPQHWRSFGPVADVSIPVGSVLSLVADVQAPYVFNESKFGDQINAGPVLKITSHLDLKAAYIQSAVPGDQGQWSGHGFQASATLRF